MRRFQIALPALLLSACSNPSPVEEAVKEQLRDPDSAKFGEVAEFTDKDGQRGACVMVNAKNAVGGYTGDRLFYALHFEDEGWQAMESPVQLGDCSWYIAHMGFTPK